MQSFLELCKQRYSVRSFSPKALQQAELDYILEAAKVAPTARNNQPWRIYILQSEEALAKIAGVSDCIFGAPCVFLICCHEEEAWHSPVDEGYLHFTERRSFSQDCRRIRLYFRRALCLFDMLP